MRKIILGIILLFFAISGYGQLITKQVKLDSLVTVSLPSTYQKKDTAGEQIYTANSMYGYEIVFRQTNEKNNTPLKKEKDLKKVLKDYIKGIQAQADGGVALNVRDTTIGRLEAKTFTLKSDDGSGNIQYRNFVLVYTQEATYTFEYVYPGDRIEVVKDEYKGFLASIKLSPELQRNDQYLSNNNGMSSIAKIAIFGGGGLVIILVVVLVVKRKKKLAVS